MQISEQMVALQDVPATLPKRGGRPIHLSTIYRWVHRGCRGRKLEVAQIGGQIFTTHEALNRFFSPNSETASQPKVDVGSSAAILRAERELAAFGI
ncbi:MAG: DUF1580 domain-containing protein [Planctomycetota bacterium]|nr:DUF1580 domain-containing protein [Planctomycetota bacterium]